MIERWLPVVGWEELYQASNQGRVLSVRTMWPMRPNVHQGYRRVQFYRNGKPSGHKVARLVAKAFVPNPDGKPNVNHKNGQKADDRASNLEWVTKAENIQHAFDTGLQQPVRTYGERHGRTKLTTAQVIEMRKRRLAGEKTTALARAFNTTTTCVSHICTGQTWKHIPDFISPVTPWTQRKRI